MCFGHSKHQCFSYYSEPLPPSLTVQQYIILCTTRIPQRNVFHRLWVLFSKKCVSTVRLIWAQKKFAAKNLTPNIAQKMPSLGKDIGNLRNACRVFYTRTRLPHTIPKYLCTQKLCVRPQVVLNLQNTLSAHTNFLSQNTQKKQPKPITFALAQ